jgi:ABC-type phosphate transport system permease subunit
MIFWSVKSRDLLAHVNRALPAGQLWCGVQVEKIQDLKGRVAQNLDELVQIVQFTIFLLQVTNVFPLPYRSMSTSRHFGLLGCLWMNIWSPLSRQKYYVWPLYSSKMLANFTRLHSSTSQMTAFFIFQICYPLQFMLLWLLSLHAIDSFHNIVSIQLRTIPPINY